MRRVASPVRPDLDRICADLGFAFAYADDEPYWDETVRYEFALEEVECDLEAPTAELYALCLELASRAVRDEADAASPRRAGDYMGCGRGQLAGV